jgi:hypothetical protein
MANNRMTDPDMYDEPPADQDPRGPEKPEEMGQTATIPRSLVPGEVEVGEEIVLRVDKVLEEELLVSYAPAKPEAKEAGRETKQATAPAGGSYMED